MIIAAEDIVSDAVIRRLVHEVRPELTITVSLPTRGRTYVEKKAQSLNETARPRASADRGRPRPA